MEFVPSVGEMKYQKKSANSGKKYLCLLLLHLFVVCTVNKLLKNWGSGLSFLGRKLKQFVQLLNYALRKLVKHYFLTVWVSWKRASSKQVPTVSPPSSPPSPHLPPPLPPSTFLIAPKSRPERKNKKHSHVAFLLVVTDGRKIMAATLTVRRGNVLLKSKITEN